MKREWSDLLMYVQARTVICSALPPLPKEVHISPDFACQFVKPLKNLVISIENDLYILLIRCYTQLIRCYTQLIRCYTQLIRYYIQLQGCLQQIEYCLSYLSSNALLWPLLLIFIAYYSNISVFREEKLALRGL